MPATSIVVDLDRVGAVMARYKPFGEIILNCIKQPLDEDHICTQRGCSESEAKKAVGFAVTFLDSETFPSFIQKYIQKFGQNIAEKAIEDITNHLVYEDAEIVGSYFAIVSTDSYIAALEAVAPEERKDAQDAMEHAVFMQIAGDDRDLPYERTDVLTLLKVVLASGLKLTIQDKASPRDLVRTEGVSSS